MANPPRFSGRAFLEPILSKEHDMNAPIPSPADKPRLTDVQTLRDSARRHVQDGAVPEHYRGDREKVLRLLNQALATDVVCVLRYRHHYFMARGLKANADAAAFLYH